ncbi:HD domain-containing protein [Achromobacter anxifer]|uniref:HD domain-containing protein n=1 Tax=Achromobacter anxifer TaxID=1287737 RepID=UPI0023F7D7B9|nr:HD domain-containing protein [Achromobacter anxifer]MDF8364699.1 HD domain-containing protein [Achromobacter anxifer]
MSVEAILLSRFDAVVGVDVAQARVFAELAHARVVNRDGSIGQTRRWTGEPYHFHANAVASMVATVEGATPGMVAAAYLHDTVDDTRRNPPATRVTITLLSSLFGEEVASYVDWLSEPEELAKCPRVRRIELLTERLSRSPAPVQTIKCADIGCNAPSIAMFDPKFARVWLGEKAAQLDILAKADPRLFELARTAVQAELNTLSGIAPDERGATPGAPRRYALREQ